MKAYAITLKNNDVSTRSTQRLIESSIRIRNQFNIEIFDAIYPEQAYGLMHENYLNWNYPWSGKILDIKSGLLKTAYSTKDPRKRIACFLSHYFLWKRCAELEEELCILEHDAFFINSLDLNLIKKSDFEIVGINDPRGATRLSQLYHSEVLNKKGFIVDVPKIDEENVPQGLAGNSAYVIKPEGAKRLLRLVDEFGAWPNDAIMCRQLMPKKLGVLKMYCTTIQQTQSTTSL